MGSVIQERIADQEKALSELKARLNVLLNSKSQAEQGIQQIINSVESVPEAERESFLKFVEGELGSRLGLAITVQAEPHTQTAFVADEPILSAVEEEEEDYTVQDPVAEALPSDDLEVVDPWDQCSSFNIAIEYCGKVETLDVEYKPIIKNATSRIVSFDLLGELASPTKYNNVLFDLNIMKRMDSPSAFAVQWLIDKHNEMFSLHLLPKNIVSSVLSDLEPLDKFGVIKEMQALIDAGERIDFKKATEIVNARFQEESSSTIAIKITEHTNTGWSARHGSFLIKDRVVNFKLDESIYSYVFKVIKDGYEPDSHALMENMIDRDKFPTPYDYMQFYLKDVS